VNSDGDLLLVGLELVVGVLDGGVLVGHVLQLDDRERQTVDEHHQVGPPVVVALDDRELVDHQPVVLVGLVEVGQAQVRDLGLAARTRDLHREAVAQQLVERAVVGEQRGRAGVEELPHRLGDGRRRRVGVEVQQRLLQPAAQRHLRIVVALRARLARRDVRPQQALVAELREVLGRRRSRSWARLWDSAFATLTRRCQVDTSSPKRSWTSGLGLSTNSVCRWLRLIPGTAALSEYFAKSRPQSTWYA
jgi:hypothetical protein